MSLDKKHNVQAILEAIKIAGGVKELSHKLNTSYQSILDWKNERKTPTALNCLKIEKATEGKVKAKDILPSYPWDDLK